MKNIRFLLLIIFTTINFNTYAFENKDLSISTETSSDDVKNDNKEEEETIESFIKKNELNDRKGFLHIWIDAEKDDYYLLLNSNDLNKEFIYFTYVLDAPQASGNFGGSLSDGSILEFREFKKDIGLFKKNTKFIYDNKNNISMSKLRNIQEAFLGRFEIAVSDEKTNQHLLKINKESKRYFF